MTRSEGEKEKVSVRGGKVKMRADLEILSAVILDDKHNIFRFKIAMGDIIHMEITHGIQDLQREGVDGLQGRDMNERAGTL